MAKISFILFTLLFSSILSASESDKVKMFVLDCGQINIRPVAPMSARIRDLFMWKKATLSNPCYLFQKGDQEFLWETGNPDRIAKYEYGIKKYFGAFNFQMKKKLIDQLAELNLTPKDIEQVAVSHMHYDHAGNLNYFKTSQILIQTEEQKAAYSKKPSKYHFEVNTYNEISQDQYVLLDGEYDVFGGGEVVIKKAVGHTPGHQLLYVQLESGPIVISGDLYHFEENREHQRVPWINFDRFETRESMRHVENYVLERAAEVWVQHDLKRFEQTKLAPEFYILSSN